MVLTQKQKIIAGVVFVLIVCGFAWFMFRPDPNVSSDGSGSERVRSDIQSASGHNAAAGSELAGAQQTAGDLERANEELRRTSEQLEIASEKLRNANEELERLANEGAERNKSNGYLAERGKQIVRQIRERYQSGNQSP